MATVPTIASPVAAQSRPILPLTDGERLSRAEFLRRYAAMPPKVKAERIEGTVYMSAAAVSAGFHGDPHAKVVAWLGTYEAATPGVVASDNSTVALDPDNDPQPDASLRILPSHGGATNLNDGKYIEGAPELIVEITGSSVGYDLGAKLNAYQRTGVREYLVHRTYDGEIDWFVLRNGQYARLSAGADGIYRSEIFPGLWLKADALIAGKLADVLTTLHRGTAAPEHAEFVKKLQEAAGRSGT
jgi:Uma2 family endonuclease